MKALFKFSAAGLALALSALALSAAPLAIDPAVTVDPADDDATFQAMPALDVKDKVLCLWNGQTLQAFILCVHEDYGGSLKNYIGLTTASMKKEGATDLKFTAGDVIKTASGASIHRYDTAYTIQGKTIEQLYYVCPVKGGYQAMIVSFTDPGAVAAIRARVDKIFGTAEVKDAIVTKT